MTANWAGTIGTVASLVSGYSSYAAQNKQIEAQNAANKAAWEEAAQATRDQLTIAYNRTLTSLNEINRDKINTKLAARVAGHQATGTANVQAAQLGIVGKRGSNTTNQIEREVANQVSDANINAAIQTTNATMYYTDVAEKAVSSLNNQSPTSINKLSFADGLSNTLSSGVNYYNKLTPAQQSDVKSNLKTAVDTIKNPIQLGG